MIRKLHSKIILLILLLISSHLTWGQQITVNTGYTPTQLIQDVFVGGGCMQIQNITYSGAAAAKGYFSNGTAAIGLANGVILSTGNASGAVGTGGSAGTFASTDMGQPGDATLDAVSATDAATEDRAALEFDFRPTISPLTFRYVFASEEYPEYVGTQFNDIFGFFISGPGITGQQNIALVPGTTTAVAINSVNQNTNATYYNANNGNFHSYDGYTDVLTATATVQTCQWYHIKLVIADRGDGIFDSAVFLEGNSFNAGVSAVATATYQNGAANAVEGCINGSFTFTRSDITDTATPQIVTYTVLATSTATNGVDYTASPGLTGTITIPAGQTSATITINALLDAIPEGVETISIQLPGNNCNCTGPPAPVTLNIYNSLAAGVSIAPVTAVCGGQSATLTATVTAGWPFMVPAPPHFNYQWSNGSTQSSISVNPASTTTYTVTMTDGCGSTATASQTVTVSPSLNVSLAPTNPSCGGNNGSIAVSVSGGTPQTYTWNPAGASGANPSGLAAGTYSVTVNSSSGCTGSATVTLNASANISASLTPTPTSCQGGNNGSISMSITGGNAPYSFVWSPASIGNIQNPTNLTAGTYNVTVTSANGCTGVANTTITNGPPITASVAASTTTCDGASDATISVTPGGGSAPYNYTWSPNIGNVASASNIGVNNYSVTVTDANNCTAIASGAVVAGPPITASLTPSPTLCSGSADGSLQLAISGGASPYTFVWNPSSLNGQQNPINLAAGTYRVTVTSANGCMASAQAIIQAGPPMSVALTPQAPACGNGNDGGIQAAPSGGLPPYNYAWSVPGVGNNDVALFLTPGSYSVTVTASNGCTASATTSVPAGPSMSVALTPTPTTCGGSTDGSVTATPSGGTAPYSYFWSPSNTNSNTINNLAGGTYSVTVTADNGCTASATTTVQPGSPMSVALTPTPTTCSGGNGGSVSVAVSGGTTPYSYTWSPATLSGNNPANLSGGSYSVTVTAANGCSASANTTVNQGPPMTAALSPTPVSCNNANNGSLQLNVSGGTTPYVYTWNPATVSGQNPTGLAAGSYNVTVTSANGCSASATATINQPTALSASVTPQPALCAGQSTGSLSASASGGTSPYSYIWSGGLPPVATHTNTVAAGSYTVTVTDANNCTAVATATVTQNTALSASIVPTDGLCNAGNTTTPSGSLSVTVNGGSVPYTYSWSGGLPSVANPTNVAAGSYTVTVTDASGCTALANSTINQPPLLNVSTTPTPALCANQNSGSLSATASGGTPNYTYNWSGGLPATANPTNVAAGSYNVTVTDNNGCTASSSATITAPPAIAVSITPQAALCNSTASGSLQASAVGGTPNYTYNWSGGLPAVANPTNVAAGSYTVTVTDANGCTAVGNSSVPEPTPVSVSTTASPTLCAGQSTGTLTATASGGTPPYQYDWSGSLPDIQNILNAAPTGTHSVMVTDANGCTAQSSTTITEPAPISASLSTTDAICGGVANGSLQLTVSGGTTPYNYQWTGGLPAIEDHPAVPAGNYSVTVTDTGGCTAVANAVINEPTALSVSILPSNITCNGQTNGSLEATVSGGTPNYTYSWSGGLPPVAVQSGNVAAGNYSVTVTDANGCTISAVSVVGQPAPLFVSLTPINPSCNGNTDGSITAVVSGGTPNYSFVWNNPAISGNSANNLLAGTYSVTVTDANNCTFSTSATLTEPSAVSGSSSTTTAACGQSNGTATVSASGGVAPYTYSWSHNPALNSTTANGLASGSYSVTVTDSNGCTALIPVAVSNANGPALSVTNTVNTLCSAANGSISVSASGGTAPLTISWSHSATFTGTTANNLPAGNYIITVEDAIGCQAVQSVTLTDTPPPTLQIVGTTNATCSQNNGDITVEAIGGTAPYNYNWSAPGGSSATLSDIGGGSYTVTVTDSNSCTNTLSITIQGSTNPDVTATPNNASCNLPNGSISLAVNNGTSPFTYNWQPATVSGANPTGLDTGTYFVTVTDALGCTNTATTSIINLGAPVLSVLAVNDASCSLSNGNISVSATGGNNLSYSWSLASIGNNTTANNIPSGTYTVTVTDANGCQDTESIVVGDSPVPQLTVVGNTNATCNLNNGEVSVAASNLTGSANYTWGAPVTSNSATASGLGAGSYSVTVSDDLGCTAALNIPVTNTPPPTLSGTANEATCGLNNGSINLNVSGGATPFSFTWLPASALGQNPNGLAAGNYSVTVTDGNNCTANASFAVSAYPPPIVVINSLTHASCGLPNGAISVSGDVGEPPFDYDWSGGLFNGFGNQTDVAAGTYTVTVTDNNGCTASESISILSSQGPSLSPDTSTPASCGNANGAASVTTTGGIGSLTYTWSAAGVGNTPSAINLPAGTYTVTVTDSNSCSDTETVTVSSINGPTILAPVIVNETCGNENGSIAVNISSGTSPYSYQWSNNALLNNSNNTNLSAGSYSVTVTDANNCTATATATITNIAGPVLTLSNTTQAACGQANGGATVSVSGGLAPIAYTWSAAAVGNSPTAGNLSAGGYSVTATDGNGCSDILPIAITNQGGPTIVVNNILPDACGQGIGSISVTASGGTGTLTYSWSQGGGNGATATGLVAGNYFVTVADANDCEAVASATVDEQAAPAVQVTTIAPATCGLPNGSVGLTTTGGTGAITYTWSPNVSAADNANNLLAGDYSVTVNDINGCQDQVTFTIDNISGPTLLLDTTTPASCGQFNGSAAVIATGIAPFTYTWSHDAALNSPSAPNMAAGSYTVTVSDANSCQATLSVTVPSLNGPVISVDNVTPETCGAGNGSISISVSGSNGAVSYSWSDNLGNNSPNNNGLAGGTYTVSITDATGCQVSESIDVESLAGPLIELQSTNPTCIAAGSMTCVALLGSSAIDNYAWSNGSTGSSINITTISFGFTCYTVTVTDANGCTASASSCVDNPVLPVLNLQAATDATCGNNNGTATVNVEAGTGTGNFTYTWSDAAIGNTNTPTGMAGGNYSVTVTDEAGCSDSVDVPIIATSSPTLVPDTSTPASCGQTDGTASVLAGGGSGPYNYTWLPNVSSADNANNIAAGTYSVTVTDNNGCTGSTTVTVANVGGPTLITATTSATCGNSNGGASITASSGTTPYSYAWSPNVSSGDTATDIAAGTYSVTVTDNNGCAAVTSVTVADTPSPTLSVSSTQNATCGNDNGQITVTATSGVSPYSYTWSHNATLNAATASGLAVGAYSITVTDVNGCSGVANGSIANIAGPTLQEDVITPASCGQADGSASVIATGGTTPYAYTWQPTVGSDNSATNIAAGAYNVTVTDDNGCTASLTLNVPNANGPTATISATPSTCEAAEGSATVAASGGITPYSYTWSHDATLNNNTASGLNPGDYICTITDANGCIVTIDVTVPGSIPPPVISCGAISNNSVEFIWTAVPGAVSYEITVNGTTQTVDASQLSYTVTGLALNETANISIVTVGSAVCGQSAAAVWSCQTEGCPTISPLITGLAATYCIDDASVTLTGTPSGGIFSGIGITGNTFSPAVAGSGTHTITYTYTDADGCTGSTTQDVWIAALPEPTFSGPESLCTGDSGVFTFTGTILAGASYTWNFGTAGSFTGVGPHTVIWNTAGNKTVTLTMTTAEGCSVVVSNTVPVSDVSVTMSASLSTIDAGASTQLTATAISGLGGEISYAWTPADGSLSCADCAAPNATSGATTTYFVTATDSYGCEASASLAITTEYHKKVIIPNAFSPNGDNINDLFRVSGQNIAQIDVSVRNRWGNEVYHLKTSDLMQGWDGIYNSKPQEIGVYVYYVVVTFTDNSEEFFKGNITLVR